MSEVSIDRHGANASVVNIGPVRFVFSYDTCVAFYDLEQGGWCCSENVWTQTTGKHLGMLVPGRAKVQVPNDEFERRLALVTERIEVAA